MADCGKSKNRSTNAKLSKNIDPFDVVNSCFAVSILYRARKIKGVSQLELANKMNGHPSTISDWERMKHFPSYWEVVKAFKILEIDTKYLAIPHEYLPDNLDFSDEALTSASPDIIAEIEKNCLIHLDCADGMAVTVKKEWELVLHSCDAAYEYLSSNTD